MISQKAKADILKLEAKGETATPIFEELKPKYKTLKREQVVNTITWARQKRKRDLKVVGAPATATTSEPTTMDVLAAQLQASATVMKMVKLIASQENVAAEERLKMIAKALE